MRDCRVLLFAYHYPPDSAIGGVRPFRFCKYLKEHAYHCHVITAADTSGYSPEEATHVSDPFDQRRKHSFGWQSERAVRKLLLPGAVGAQWALKAAVAGRQFVNKHRGDRFLVLSTFPPLGAHLAGWRLAQQEHLQWIADLRDPFPLSSVLRTNSVWRWLERSCLQSASAVIANTDAAQAMLQQLSPKFASKVQLIPNGFDPAERLTPLPIPSRPYEVLAHVGELYAGRTAAPVLESMARLIGKGRLPPDAIRVELVGPADPSCLSAASFLEKATSAGWLSIRSEQVPKAEAQAIAQTADRLLLLQPHTAVQTPAKLFEYVQIGRPILALLLPGSSSERILKDSGISYRAVYPESGEQARDAAVLEFFGLTTEAHQPNVWFEENFNVRSQTAALARIMEDVISMQ